MNQIITGLKTCPNWLRIKYKEAVKGICQECHRPETNKDKLEPHRLIRKNKGGLYTLVPLNHQKYNIKVVHHSCHKKYHSNEFRNCQGK